MSINCCITLFNLVLQIMAYYMSCLPYIACLHEITLEIIFLVSLSIAQCGTKFLSLSQVLPSSNFASIASCFYVVMAVLLPNIYGTLFHSVVLCRNEKTRRKKEEKKREKKEKKEVKKRRKKRKKKERGGGVQHLRDSNPM